jgi:hypothetical protein
MRVAIVNGRSRSTGNVRSFTQAPELPRSRLDLPLVLDVVRKHTALLAVKVQHNITLPQLSSMFFLSLD